MAQSEMFGITRDRHIGQTEKVIENDTELRAQLLSVLLLEFHLRRRQMWADGIINEVQQKIATGPTVADLVQALQSADAQIECPFAALPVNVFFGIAGQGAD